MPNKYYIKGYRKELKLVNLARRDGHIAFRTAGSHSPIDVCKIDRENKEITFIQAKAGYISDPERKRIEDQLDFLKGKWTVKFELL